MHELLGVSLGYVLGSIPFAFLISRRHGVDLRAVGSGNVGASNVLRSTGVGSAILAMLLDALKGSAAVLLAQRLVPDAPAVVAAAFASVLGHIHPVWLRFRGGKGVATAAGAFGILAPAALLAASAVFILVVWTTRYVSAGSLAAAATLAVAAAITDVPGAVVVGALLTAALVAHQHRDNVSRLVAGTERRLGQRLS